MKYNNPNITNNAWLTIVLQTHMGGNLTNICVRLLAGDSKVRLSNLQRKYLASILSSQHQILQMYRHSNVQLLCEAEGTTPSLNYTNDETILSRNTKFFLKK